MATFSYFFKSLSTGIFLNHWKISEVVPIHKSGIKHDVCNYRPISKILCIPKLLEKIVTSKLSPQINMCLSDNQHGFRSGRSTCTNLVLFTNFVFQNFKSRLQTDVIYTDFAKAFDKVCHETLLLKLNCLGFKGQFLCWLSSYLKDRFQFVKINHNRSRLFQVTSGVPQGSHLGPLLFLLFINDLSTVIQFSNSLLFADDLKIYRSISNTNDCMLLQSDINSVVNWCKNNNLVLNIKKCQVFSLYRSSVCIQHFYYIDSELLVRVNSIKDLGIILDPKLDFKNHIDFIISKSMAMLGFLKRNSSEFSNPKTLIALYNSLVRPHLEYCCVIWNPISNSNISRIERIQKNFTRYIFFKLGWRMERPDYDTRCALFGLCSLEKRRKMFSIIFVRDLIHNHINCSNLLALLNFYAPRRPLREKFYFVLYFNRSNYYETEPIYHCCKITNSILTFIDFFNHCTRSTFKTNLLMILNQRNSN